MKSKWLWAFAPVLGLACISILGGTAMQAQVGSEPKAAVKTRPAERAAPAEERAAPREERAAPAEAVKAATKNGAERRAADETPARSPARRDRDSREQKGGGWLGVYVDDVDEANPVAGVQISKIFPASPAARAGFRSSDVITHVNDQKVTDPQSFVSVIETMSPGTKTAFAVQRGNQTVKIAATLGENYWISRGQSEDYGDDFDGARGRGNQEEYPIHALELEHHRRNSEQHERMEQMLYELKEEVRQLREELKAKK
jgi:hypothetical protein